MSLLVAAACCPSAMFGQGSYTANAFVVYVAADGTDDLLWTEGAPGGWDPSLPVTGQFSALPPALAAFNGNAFLAYVANNGTHDLLVTIAGDPSATSTPVTGGQSSSMSPALTVFGNELVLAYVANNSTHDLLVTTSTDGVHWTKSAPVGGQSSVAPALTTFGNELVLAYVLYDGNDDLLVTTSTDGVHWTPWFTEQYTSLSPALTVFDGELVLAYVANDGTNDLWVTTSTDGGVLWNTRTPVTGQKSPVTPALSVIPNPTQSQAPFTTFNLMMVYVANNGSNDLFVTTSANGTGWTTSTPITGQSSRVTPALCIVENYNSQ